MSRRRRNRLPQGIFRAHIESLTHDGRGLAHMDGKAVFIRGGLPGENVGFRYIARHRQYDEGQVDEIVTAAPDRIEPRCAHFGICGGCSMQHLAADKQVQFKQEWLLDHLARIGKIQPETVLEPLIGPHWGYRHKARLGVKHVVKKGRVLVGFRERGSALVADLRRCEVLHPRVGGLLEELAEMITALSIHDRLPQIEVAIGDEAVALNFRVLAPPSEADMSVFIAFAQRHNLHIWLQPEGPETSWLLWPKRAVLDYRLPRYDLALAFRPYHFTQVNASINRRMVDRVVELLDLETTDAVLDLFCGLGNFTLALARRAGWITGVEGDRSLVDWARRNADRNRIENVDFYATDLAKDVQEQPWMRRRYDKILLDPPRSGALEMIPRLAALGARRVAYVSCHPATLARDVGELVHRCGYRLRSAGIMDMFPHTAHVESIAVLER